MKHASFGVAAFSNYQGLDHTLLSSAEKFRLLAKMVKARDANRPKAYRRHRDKVISTHLRFALSLVRRFAGNAAILQIDLLQVAAVGLQRACKTYDPSRNVAFTSYAGYWVRARIQRELANHGRTIRVPVHRIEEGRKVSATIARFESWAGRAPTDNELALASGISAKRLRKLTIDGASLPIGSLDAPLSTHGQTQGTLLDVLQSPAPSPEETLQERETSTSVRRLLNCLPAKERAVITMRMGLDGSKPRTLAEVGAVFGFSRERSRQLEAQALDRMRRAAKFMNQDFRAPKRAQDFQESDLGTPCIRTLEITPHTLSQFQSRTMGLMCRTSP